MTGLSPRFHLTGQRIPGKAAEAQSESEVHFQWEIGERQEFTLTSYPQEITSLPEILWKHGYLTAIVAANPLYGLSGLLYDGTQIAINSGGSGDLLNWVVKRVLSDIPQDQPLFLLVHYMDVHNWENRFREKHTGMSPQTARREEILESYGAAVRQSDEFLGELLSLWNANRAMDDTLLIFFSDHGEHLMDPLLGHGNAMSQTLLHVPLVIRYPAVSRVEAGVVRRNVSLMDVFPTSLDVLDIPHDLPKYQGRSLLGDADSRRPLFADFQLFGDNLSSVINGNEKLVLNLTEGSSEVFRIMESGEEQRIGDAGEKADSLRASFRAYKAAAEGYGATLKSQQVVDRKRTIETLKSLGYIR